MIIWVNGKIRFSTLLNRTTIGYFSSLSAVEKYLKTAREKSACRWYFSKEVGFRIFEVSKFTINNDEEEQGHWVYDEAGKLYGDYEGSERDKFQGRTAEEN